MDWRLYYKLLRAAPVALRQRLGAQALGRTPEPAAMDDPRQVEQFDAAGDGDLAIHYATAIRFLEGLLVERGNLPILDVCCGSGQFALRLHRALGLRVFGVDMAPAMVCKAKRRAMSEGISDEVQFQVARAEEMPYSDASFSAATFILAAHHFAALDDVGKLLVHLDRIVEPSGVIVLLDLCRLKTVWQSRRYCTVFGRPELPLYERDFEASMLASFTPAELALAMPANAGSRIWMHLVEPALQAVQLMVGFSNAASLAAPPPCPIELAPEQAQLHELVFRPLWARLQRGANRLTDHSLFSGAT